MNRRACFIAVALALIAAGLWMATHRSRPTAVADSSSERKVLYWHDPMVPDQRFDKPGKSPFMNMELVPVYADDAADSGVKVSSNVVQTLGIRLGNVERQRLTASLDAVGSVALDETRMQLIQARGDGFVSELFIRSPMARVHKGQRLAMITSPTWLAATKEYAALLANDSPQFRELRAAARAKLVVLGIATAEIESIERTHFAESALPLVAPIDGVVTELGVREGSSFANGAILFRLNGLQTVWVNAQVPEAQIHLVRSGARISAQAVAWPGVHFDGEVIALLPEVDQNTRTITMRTMFKNSKEQLAPGMFLSLELKQAESVPQLVVPSEAVILTGTRTVVITAREDGSFAVANVTIGRQFEDKTVVIDGLAENQSIVLSGQFLIDSEASLTSTIDRLAAVKTQSIEQKSGTKSSESGALEPNK